LGVSFGVIGALAGGCMWAWQSGRLGSVVPFAGDGVMGLTADLGFRVGEVLVEGRGVSKRTELLEALAVSRGDPILGVDLVQARNSLEALPWVAAASVERRLPDTLYVRIAERRPLALWQHNQKFMVIDRRGKVLTDEGVGRFSNLPVVVGAEAAAHAPELLGWLAGEPKLAKRVTAATWISDRRWNLQLDNGVTVKLPEKDVAPALRRLADLSTSRDLLDRDVTVIDLRQPDRLTVQSSAAVAARPKLRGEKI